jgi:hypothetical protein
MIWQCSAKDAITASTSSRLKASSILRMTSSRSSDIARPVSRSVIVARFRSSRNAIASRT